ncbi:41578_t:CDS:2 [Gigaspora margarita]|uniref:41578_t:CDS:1 n=1 Tax=Gigaspora margarita TaxID=4874 RepID=A0ABN7VJH3_GIGMA|nr:41578_t:CDS:2 [Gigaspora margarita]
MLTNLTDPNTISNSDTNPEDNNTSSDKSLSGDNISTDLNSITDHSNEASNTDHSNKTVEIIAQPTINEMFHHAAGQNTRQKKSINCALVKWIVTNLQPFYVLKSDSFIKFIYALNSYYKLPSDKHVKALIHQNYNNSVEYLKTYLATEIKMCGLMCDLWTAHSRNRYIGITCHFINSNYELKEVILAIKYVPYPYDAVSIKAELEEVIND